MKNEKRTSSYLLAFKSSQITVESSESPNCMPLRNVLRMPEWHSTPFLSQMVKESCCCKIWRHASNFRIFFANLTSKPTSVLSTKLKTKNSYWLCKPMTARREPLLPVDFQDHILRDLLWGPAATVRRCQSGRPVTRPTCCIFPQWPRSMAAKMVALYQLVSPPCWTPMSDWR